MKPLERPRNRSTTFAKQGPAPAAGPAKTGLVAALAGLAMALGLAAPAAVVHAHDASTYGAGGILHNYRLKFCAKRDTADNTHSSKDDYYKVKFEYRWKDVGHEPVNGITYGHETVPWYSWGSDADIHVASQYTGEWRCRSKYTKAVLAGHGRSNGGAEYINGRVTTSDGNTTEIDIDYWVNTLKAKSVCALGTYSGYCWGHICFSGKWHTALWQNCK